MDKDTIGFASGTGSSADGEIGEGPDAVHDEGVKAMSIGAEPEPEAGGETKEAEVRGPESMDGTREAAQKGGIGVIGADDFCIDTEELPVPDQLANSFGGSAVRGS